MSDQIQVELQAFMGSDRSIAEAAWTSSTTLQGKEKRTEEDVARVVKMLINDQHASPIESVVFRFWIKLPIAADRQHMTHRIASQNGMSGRYRTMPSEYLEMAEDVLNTLVLYSDPSLVENEYDRICAQANVWYVKQVSEAKKAKENGLITNNQYKRIREFMRGVLPQHNMTERVTVMNLRSFANYQKLRNSEHAQPEIRQISQLMLEAVEKANVCPVALEELKKNGWEI